MPQSYKKQNRYTDEETKMRNSAVSINNAQTIFTSKFELATTRAEFVILVSRRVDQIVWHHR